MEGGIYNWSLDSARRWSYDISVDAHLFFSKTFGLDYDDLHVSSLSFLHWYFSRLMSRPEWLSVWAVDFMNFFCVFIAILSSSLATIRALVYRLRLLQRVMGGVCVISAFYLLFLVHIQIAWCYLFLTFDVLVASWFCDCPSGLSIRDIEGGILLFPSVSP